MSTNTKSETINHDRRRLFSTAAMALAAARLGMIGSANAQSGKVVAPIRPGSNTSFASLRQINAGVLNVGYAEAGRADGPVVVLLHGTAMSMSYHCWHRQATG